MYTLNKKKQQKNLGSERYKKNLIPKAADSLVIDTKNKSSFNQLSTKSGIEYINDQLIYFDPSNDDIQNAEKKVSRQKTSETISSKTSREENHSRKGFLKKHDVSPVTISLMESSLAKRSSFDSMEFGGNLRNLSEIDQTSSIFKLDLNTKQNSFYDSFISEKNSVSEEKKESTRLSTGKEKLPTTTDIPAVHVAMDDDDEDDLVQMSSSVLANTPNPIVAPLSPDSTELQSQSNRSLQREPSNPHILSIESRHSHSASSLLQSAHPEFRLERSKSPIPHQNGQQDLSELNVTVLASSSKGPSLAGLPNSLHSRNRREIVPKGHVRGNLLSRKVTGPLSRSDLQRTLPPLQQQLVKSASAAPTYSLRLNTNKSYSEATHVSTPQPQLVPERSSSLGVSNNSISMDGIDSTPSARPGTFGMKIKSNVAGVLFDESAPTIRPEGSSEPVSNSADRRTPTLLMESPKKTSEMCTNETGKRGKKMRLKEMLGLDKNEDETNRGSRGKKSANKKLKVAYVLSPQRPVPEMGDSDSETVNSVVSIEGGHNQHSVESLPSGVPHQQSHEYDTSHHQRQLLTDLLDDNFRQYLKESKSHDQFDPRGSLLSLKEQLNSPTDGIDDGQFGDRYQEHVNTIPYQVHRRIMGWKLTSVRRRRDLVGMLDILTHNRTHPSQLPSPKKLPGLELEHNVTKSDKQISPLRTRSPAKSLSHPTSSPATPVLQIPHSMLRTRSHQGTISGSDLEALQKLLLRTQPDGPPSPDIGAEEEEENDDEQLRRTQNRQVDAWEKSITRVMRCRFTYMNRTGIQLVVDERLKQREKHEKLLKEIAAGKTMSIKDRLQTPGGIIDQRIQKSALQTTMGPLAPVSPGKELKEGVDAEELSQLLQRSQQEEEAKERWQDELVSHFFNFNFGALPTSRGPSRAVTPNRLGESRGGSRHRNRTRGQSRNSQRATSPVQQLYDYPLNRNITKDRMDIIESVRTRTSLHTHQVKQKEDELIDDFIERKYRHGLTDNLDNQSLHSVDSGAGAQLVDEDFSFGGDIQGLMSSIAPAPLAPGSGSIEARSISPTGLTLALNTRLPSVRPTVVTSQENTMTDSLDWDESLEVRNAPSAELRVSMDIIQEEKRLGTAPDDQSVSSLGDNSLERSPPKTKKSLHVL